MTSEDLLRVPVAPINILVINDFAYVNGGAAAVALASAAGLARRGHRVTFLAAVGPVSTELTNSGVNVVCLGQQEILGDSNRWRAARQGIWNGGAHRACTRVLSGADRLRTIVHIHGWTKALSSSVVRASFDLGFHAVCTLHDYFVACPNGAFLNYKNLAKCDLKPLSGACIATNCDPRAYLHKLWRVGRQLVQLSAGRIPDGISNFITLSELNRTLLRPHLPLGARLFSLANPIDLPREPRVPVGQNKYYTMIGRLSPEKGAEVLAQAGRRCSVPVLFVGDGPARSKIKAEYNAAQISGWVDRRGVLNSLSISRALVFPSLWYEAQPLAVLEAASKGVPSVVSDECAAREWIEHGVTGLLFRNGDAESLAKAIRRLQNDRLVEDLGSEAYRRYWAKPPTLESHLGALEEIYMKILERRI